MSFYQMFYRFLLPRSLTTYWGIQFQCACGARWQTDEFTSHYIVENRLNICKKCGLPARYFRKRISLL